MTASALTADRRQYFHVIERKGWSYVKGPFEREYGGPWRYRWEAQEYADELNAKAGGR